MWYLLFLFLISLIWLPLMLPRKKSGVSPLARTAPLFGSPWSLLLLALLVSGMRFVIEVLDLGFLRGTGGWSFLAYAFFLPIGYLLFCTDKMRETVRKMTWISLGLAVALSTLGMVMQHSWRPPVGYLSAQHYAHISMESLRALCWVVAFIGIGQRFLSFSNRFVRHGNEAVLPFYILHQFVILLIGYYVVIPLDLPIFPKYLLVVVLAFLGIMIPYELLIRRFNPLRVLFGMRSRKKAR